MAGKLSHPAAREALSAIHRSMTSTWRSASNSSSSSFAKNAWKRRPEPENEFAADDEFWVVEGEILRLKAGSEKNPVRMALRGPPSENQNVSRKQKAKTRVQRVMASLIPKSERGQEGYWNTYFQRYRTVLEQWEKLYHDGVPDVQPAPVLVDKNDPYTILGLPRRTKQYSPVELKSAYREMALKYHPDRNPGNDAEARFEKIWNAYKMLQHKRSWR